MESLKGLGHPEELVWPPKNEGARAMNIVVMIEAIYKLFTLVVSAAVLIIAVTNCSIKLAPKDRSSGVVAKFNNSPNIQLSLRGLNIHRYLAEIAYPPGYSNIRLEVNDQVWASDPQPQTQALSFGLEDNKTYLIKLFGATKPEESSGLIAEWTVATPRDVLLNQDTFNQLTTEHQSLRLQADRVFIPEGTLETPTLVTGGKNLVVLTNQLIANGAVLATFGKGDKASLNQPGRSGGVITIKALKARGALTLVMRGQEGGDGSAGQALPRAAQGAQGTKGRSHCRSRFLGGDPVVACRCLEVPGHGSRGSDGVVGQKGNPGRQGGATGRLNLEIAERPDSDWQFIVLKEAGPAGLPGAGGPGQLGGLGGDIGRLDDARECPTDRSHKGDEGSQGPNGPLGDREANGLDEQECLSEGVGYGKCSI